MNIKILLLSIFLTLSWSISAMTNSLCGNNIECIKEVATDVVENKKIEIIDVTINQVEEVDVKSLFAWKYNALGALYLLKKDEISLSKAESFLVSAEKLGSKVAIHNLAELYFLKEEFEKSLEYLNKSLATGIEMPSKDYIDWARLYAQHLYFGYGLEKELMKSKELFYEIRDLDKTGISYFFLAQFTLKNEEIDKTIELLNKSAEKNYPKSMLALGDIYRKGLYIDQNDDLAISYYLSASKLNSNVAHMNLALMYKEKRDLQKMKNHLIKAAELGNIQALEFFNKRNR